MATNLVADLEALATALGTDVKTLTTAVGVLSSLTTADKTSLVAAINEVKAGSAGSPPDATTTVKGVVELATNAETTTGTDTVRAVTPAGVQAAIDALVAAAPGTLNTLDELAAAVGDDANFAATITTALANRVRHDAAQGLGGPAQVQARSNIAAAAAVDVGNVAALDSVATYNAAKA